MAKMVGQFLFNSIRQYSDAVFESFPITNDDLVLSEINIFNPQTNGFHKAKAAAVEQPVLSRHAAY